MAFYFLAEIESINDPEKYAEYIGKAEPIVEKYGGTYIVKSEKLDVISGNWNTKKIVLIKFNSKEAIGNCFGSAEYLRIKHLRTESTGSKSMVIEE